MTKIDFYSRPANFSFFTKKFDKCDEIRITARGTGVSVTGFIEGEQVAMVQSDHPSMAVDAIRQAFHDSWDAAHENIARQIEQYYENGGRNWSGD